MKVFKKVPGTVAKIDLRSLKENMVAFFCSVVDSEPVGSASFWRIRIRIGISRSCRSGSIYRYHVLSQPKALSS
jgi:hypothetical protein